MKIKIKTYNGELPSYLTVGKVYEVNRNYYRDTCITCDNGIEIVVFIGSCSHLNGGSWEVVE